MLKTYYSLVACLIGTYTKHGEHHNYSVKLSENILGLRATSCEVCL